MSTNRWMMVGAIIASLQLSACGQKDTGYRFIEPAHVEHIEGTDKSRVTFTAKAIERTGLKVGKVTEERVSRQRRFSGEVVAQSGSSNGFIVRVADNKDAKQIARNEPAIVWPLVNHRGDPGWKATPVAGQELTYQVASANESPKPGSGVAVDLTLSAAVRKVIPYESLIYTPDGDTWVYTNPEPLVFVREHVVIDYVEGDKVVLLEGPPVGTAVVTTGALQVYGTEFEVGH